MGSSKKSSSSKAADDKKKAEAEQQRVVAEQQERARIQQQVLQAENERNRLMSMLAEQQQMQQQAYQQQQTIMQEQQERANAQATERNRQAEMPVYEPPAQTAAEAYQAPLEPDQEPPTPEQQQVDAVNNEALFASPAAEVAAPTGPPAKTAEERIAEALSLQKNEFDLHRTQQAEAQKRSEEFSIQQQKSQLDAYSKQLEEFKAATQGQLSTIQAQSANQLRSQQDSQGLLLSQLSSQYDSQKGALGEQVNAYRTLSSSQDEQLKLLQGEYSRSKSDKIDAVNEATKPVMRELATQRNRNKLLTHLSSLRGRGYNPEYNKGKLLR